MINKKLILSFVSGAIFLIVFLFTSIVCGQKITLRHLKTKEGLLSNSVTATLQDAKGEIWVGSKVGVNCYNGTSFRNYNNDVEKPKSLINGTITSIYEDSDGILWFGSYNGMARYLRETDEFESLSLVDEDTLINGTYVNEIDEGYHGRLVVATYGGVRFYDKKTGQLEIFNTHSPKGKKISHSSASCTEKDNLGNIWVGTWKGIDIIRDGVSYVKDFGKWNAIIQNAFVSTLALDQDYMWIGTYDKGLFKYHLPSGDIIRYHSVLGENLISHFRIQHVMVSSDGDVWVGTKEGLTIIHPDGKIDNYKDNGETTFTVLHISEDRNKGKWLSTYQVGVDYYHPALNRIEYLPYTDAKGMTKSFRRQKMIISLKADDHLLWMGNRVGLSKFDFSTSTYKLFISPNDVNKMNTNWAITAIEPFGKDKFWLGTNHELIEFDKLTGKEVLYTHDPNAVNTQPFPDNIKSLLMHGDTLYFGSNWPGIAMLNTKTGIFKHVMHTAQNGGILNHANSIISKGEDNLLIGTATSLITYHIKTGKFESYWYINSKGQEFNININQVYIDRHERIWLATVDKGLALFDWNQKKIIKLPLDEYLIGKSISSITESKNSLWLGLDDGLARMAFSEDPIPTLLRFSHFNEEDGIKNAQFTEKAVTTSPNGSVFFGSYDGVSYFHPEGMQEYEESFDVLFTKMVSSGKGTSEINEVKLLSQKNVPITIDNQFNKFDIYFSALNFVKVENTIYSYMLEGFDKKWTHAEDIRSVSYTNLSGGKEYTFKIKASTNSAINNNNTASLSLYLEPKYYETYWFRLLIVLLLVFAVLFIAKLRTRQLEINRKKLEKLVAEQNRELKSQYELAKAQNIKIEEQYAFSKEQNIKIEEQYSLLQSAQTELKEINEELESKVDKRTETLKNTVGELNKSMAELDRFVYSASHDLSSPLKSILGLVTIAKSEIKKKQTDGLEQYFEYIELSVNKLEEVINCLIDFSKNKSQEIEKETVYMRKVIDEVIQELQFMDGARQIHFAIGVEKEVTVETDYRRLKIILSNLIGNSIKYMDLEKKEHFIKIDFGQNGNNWNLLLTDNGIGFDSKESNRVFDMFYRGTNKSTGSGLGLYIVKEAVSKMRGKISVQANTNIGTTFALSFPYRETLVDQNKVL